MATHTIAEVPQALADEVDGAAIGALMLNRSPDFLEPTADDDEIVTETVLGVAQEVAPLAGLTTATQRWNLAVRAVTLGSALSIEDALYPRETGLDQTGLSRSLTLRYKSVLAQLDGRFPDDAEGQREPGQVRAPRGSFPPALPYPDPARW